MIQTNVLQTPNFNLEKKLASILTKKNNSLGAQFPGFLVEFKHESFPIDIRKIYGGYDSYVLELGSGWGDFALEYAVKNSSNFYLAIDKKKYRIKKSIKDQNRLINNEIDYSTSLQNLKWMVCNFDWIFSNIFTQGSFDKIIINFPDPWPKKRHQKHRFVKPEFIENLGKFLSNHGILEFATDNWSYMESVIDDFGDSGKWININGENNILPHMKDRPVSFFENLKRSEKENIYFIQLKKLFA